MSDQEERIKISFETNADQTKQSVDGVANSVNKTTEASENLAKTQNKVTNSNKEQKASFEDLGGGIGGTINQVKSLGKQFLALLANPIVLFIGAIVGALALLYKAFASTNDGADKVEQVMKGLGAVVDILRDRFLKFAGAIVKALKGDFTGAMNDAKASVNGFGKEVESEFKQAADATKYLQEVEDATRDLGVQRAKLNRDLAESKNLIFDENASYQEKVKALNKVKEAEGKQTAQELANAKKKLEAIVTLNKLSDTSDEDLQKEADARARLYELEEKSFQDQKAVSRVKKQLDNEERARVKSIIDERKNKLKEEKAIRDEEVKRIAEFNKIVADKEKELQRQLEDLEDDTEQKKLERRKKRAEQEIIDLGIQGKKRTDLLLAVDKLFAKEQADLNDKIENEKKTAREQKQKEFLDGLKLEDEAIKEYQDQNFEFELEDIYNKTLAKIEAEKEAKQLESEALGGTPEEIEQRKRAIDNFFKAEQLKAEEDFTNGKIELKKKEKDTINSLGNQSVGLAKDIFAKNKNIQKGILVADSGVAIGKVAKNTVEGVSKAISASPLTVGMPWSGIIGAKGVLDTATIVSSTNKALQSLGGGSVSGGGATQPSTPTGVSAQPQIGVQASQENQIATSIATVQTEQPPIKAFVVSSDVTTAQNLDAKIIQENSF